MAPLTQENRQIAVATPLGTDVFLLTAFSGREEASRLFEFQLDLLSENHAIKPADIVGKNLTFYVKRAEQEPRYFNGFVSRFSAAGAESGLRRYCAEVVPWLWFLTRTADCRIFQDKTVPEIITKIFQDLGFGDYEFAEIKGSHPKWEYCVQYRETDFNFVSRLMEQEGIFYYFRHGNGGHTMVLADQASAFKPCQEAEVDFEVSGGGRSVTDRIKTWEHQYEFRPGKWSQMDYNFETPQTSLATTKDSVIKLQGNETYEIYDYPGEYEKKSDGDDDTKARIEAEELPHHIVHASGTCKTFTAGGKFTLKTHPLKSEQGKSYAILAIMHDATEPATYEGGGRVEHEYSNTFICIPDSVTFRPARITPKPVIRGSQTAVVTGPKDEEIYPDKYGRIKVQFYWDREGKADEKTSCWIRCMQTSAGKKWGSMFIPRIGQEVIVRYLEGDPDKPLVTGVVYNAGQMPHYKLPDEKTKSYIKTNSTLGGEGFNEVRLEDKKGGEQIFIHGQRNMDVRVLNDSLERIFGNRHQIIGWEKDGNKGGDQREMIYQDKHLDVKRHQIEHIEGNMELLIGHGEAESGGNWDVVVEKTKQELVEGNSHNHVKKARSESVGSQSLTAGGEQEKVTGKYALESGKEIHFKAGTTLIMEAGSQLTLKGPGGFIDISTSAIAIQGVAVDINSGGSAGTGSPCKPGSASDAVLADPKKPSMADIAKSGQKSVPASMPGPPPPGPQPGPPKPKPAPPPKPPPKPPPTVTSWIEFEVIDDETGKPITDSVLLGIKPADKKDPDQRSTNNGLIRVDFSDRDPGTCDLVVEVKDAKMQETYRFVKMEIK